nr:hypothetical protein [uncultured Sulfurimonas sp.]
MKSLIELKVYLINKYLNKDYRLDDITAQVLGGEKIEYYYLNSLLFQAIEKSLKVYEPLLLLGTTESIEKKINYLKEIVEKWNENESKYNEKYIEDFVKDYHIETTEIDNMILTLINNSLRSK